MDVKRIVTTAVVFATLAGGSAFAADRPLLFGDGSVFGPVTLGADEGLRLCHAASLGGGTQRGVWVVYRLAGDGSVKPAAVQRVAAEPDKGGCMDLAALKFFESALSTNAFEAQSVSLYAILIGLRGPSRRPADLVSSVQRFVLLDDGSARFGELLPAVQRPNLLLPALPDPQTGD
ncbi:MAG: hypothetical protein AB7I50_00030 [Vicinamibacterales bacterium]